MSVCLLTCACTLPGARHLPAATNLCKNISTVTSTDLEVKVPISVHSWAVLELRLPTPSLCNYTSVPQPTGMLTHLSRESLPPARQHSSQHLAHADTWHLPSIVPPHFTSHQLSPSFHTLQGLKVGEASFLHLQTLPGHSSSLAHRMSHPTSSLSSCPGSLLAPFSRTSLALGLNSHLQTLFPT